MQVEKGSVWTKQAHRDWYDRMDSFLTSMGFTKSKVDPNLYMKIWMMKQ